MSGYSFTRILPSEYVAATYPKTEFTEASLVKQTNRRNVGFRKRLVKCAVAWPHEEIIRKILKE